jgi:hypothetical protein
MPSPRPVTRVVLRAVHRDARSRGSGGADVFRLRALRALRGVELDALVVLQALVAAAGDGGVVHEHVLAAGIGER